MATFDPFGLAAERSRVRKVFGLPEPTTLDIETEAWACMERVTLGDLSNWRPVGIVRALGDDGDG